MAIEEPPYRVLEHDGAFELREYSPELVAETRVQSDFDGAGNEGFRRLLRYISGNNRSGGKIAMTAPVLQTPASEAGQKIAMTAPVTQAADGPDYRVAFVMPAGFTRATLPVPLDPAIEIREIPARLLAVWRYSGRWTESRYREMEQALRSALASRGLRATGTPVFARYDAPFIPWPLRRNEVLIPVDKASRGSVP
jgi:hypothetical protein